MSDQQIVEKPKLGILGRMALAGAALMFGAMGILIGAFILFLAWLFYLFVHG